MFSPFALLAVLGLFASQVLAFNVTIGDPAKNVTLTDLLKFSSSDALTSCNDLCTLAQTNVNNCNDDPTCICSSSTADSIVNCETCLFHFLIAKNEKMPDSLTGSNPVVTGYAASCKSANHTLLANQSALTLPDNWDGPFVAVLPAGGAAVTVIIGAFLGFSALMILSNLE
ncbi:hypothetical protein CVT26_007919 [Gymnopilus dilepis]|uniref:Extracellular membrane protein CFEM domain-containing protein n=1 Tax=Gymnopilus dilepis TaxID=231916 RepID=A0A409W833_9AGAR|nr:hypothetical protein CVT26_007919 [Gymnopilus dilepis]